MQQFFIWNENQLISLFYLYIAGSLHVSSPQAHLQESSYSCSHNHWFSFCATLFACPKHVEIQQYTNKIVTSVGFHSICWKDAWYKKLKTVFQFIILTFIYSSTSFGRFPAHHQELNDCSGSLWFYLCIMVTVVPCSWSGRPRTRHDCHHDTKVKPEAATAVIMMGGKTPETCRAVNKCQDNKLKNCCIWLVDLFELTCKLIFSLRLVWCFLTLSVILVPLHIII